MDAGACKARAPVGRSMSMHTCRVSKCDPASWSIFILFLLRLAATLCTEESEYESASDPVSSCVFMARVPISSLFPLFPSFLPPTESRLAAASARR